MKYIALTFAVIAFFFGLSSYLLENRLTIAEKKLSVLQAEKTALETEVRNYNEKSLQANRQIGELKKLIQEHKEDSSDGYRCLNIAIPNDIVQFLRN